MLDRKRFAPGWDGSAISWKTKNMAAGKIWLGPECLYPDAATLSHKH